MRTTTRAQAEHGTRQRYGAGCRCAECRKAWAAYMRSYKASRGAARPDAVFYRGKVNGLTPFGRRLLAVTRARTARSRWDIFEHLLRQHAANLQFDDAAAS